WFSRKRPKLLPAHCGFELPTANRLERLRFCKFFLRRLPIYSTQHHLLSFLLAREHVPWCGAGKYDAPLAICCQCHSGIIPHHASGRQERRSSGPADELERRKMPIRLNHAHKTRNFTVTAPGRRSKT